MFWCYHLHGGGGGGGGGGYNNYVSHMSFSLHTKPTPEDIYSALDPEFTAITQVQMTG